MDPATAVISAKPPPPSTQTWRRCWVTPGPQQIVDLHRGTSGPGFSRPRAKFRDGTRIQAVLNDACGELDARRRSSPACPPRSSTSASHSSTCHGSRSSEAALRRTSLPVPCGPISRRPSARERHFGSFGPRRAPAQGLSALRSRSGSAPNPGRHGSARKVWA